jgi:hypothetical protein
MTTEAEKLQNKVKNAQETFESVNDMISEPQWFLNSETLMVLKGVLKDYLGVSVPEKADKAVNGVYIVDLLAKSCRGQSIKEIANDPASRAELKDDITQKAESFASALGVQKEIIGKFIKTLFRHAEAEEATQGILNTLKQNMLGSTTTNNLPDVRVNKEPKGMTPS